MRKKVLHIIGSLNMGGAETLITDYALKINREKFEIVLVTTSGHQDTINEKKLKEFGIKTIFLGDKVVYSNATNKIKRMINKIHKYILFAKVVKEEKPNIIHTHLHTNGYITPINTKKKGIKLFHTIHSEVNVMFGKTTKKFPAKYAIKHKGMIPIALHSKMQQEANDFFGINTCIVIPNAIDVERFTEANISKAEMRNLLAIKKGSFIIGHVGRFAEQKNHKFLIDTFASLKKNQSNAHLILVGIGNLESQIKEKVKQLGLLGSVSFLGNRGDIPELMSIMDVFVFPSIYEGFGNVLIEAQAAGVKCVVSDTIPTDAFVTNLVTPLSLKDSCEKWVETIKNNKYPEKVEGNLAKHDIDNVIKDLENIYLSSGE